MNCFACRKPLPTGEVVFCSSCWWKLPPKERAGFRGLYIRSKKNPVAYRPKAESLKRILEEQAAAMPSPASAGSEPAAPASPSANSP